MKRRTFIKTTAATAAATVIAPKLAKSKVFDVIPNDEIFEAPSDNIMIILELFGGNDGLNTVVPADNDDYYNIRPNLAVPKNLLDKVVDNTNNTVYLHPALTKDVANGGMKRLFENGSLAVVEGIGFEPTNMSHFRAKDIWLSGINSSDASLNLTEGWLGRFFAKKLPDFPMVIPENPIAIQIGGTLSLMFRSKKGDMGIAINNVDDFYNLAKGLTPIEPMMTGNTDYEGEFNFVHVVAEQTEMYANAVKAAYDKGIKLIDESKYTDGLAQKFKIIAALIAGGLQTQIYYVNLSNFDSHAQQQNEIAGTDVTGQHPTLLKHIADSISGFMADATKLGFSDRVAGMTTSEFGRRAYDNGSRGTDHGAASMQFIFGGAYVNGGYFGEYPKISEDDWDEDGNIKMQFDYRRTYSEFLRVWFGATEQDIEDVFKTGGELDLSNIGVLKPRAVGVNDNIDFESRFTVYPNPNHGESVLRFELNKQSNVRINIYDLKGKLVANVYDGSLPAGAQKFDLNIINTGSYICAAIINNKRHVANFNVIR
jgi:uncharacterized protein (DUF1501 family)